MPGLLNTILKMNGITNIDIKFDNENRKVIASYEQWGNPQKIECSFDDIEAMFKAPVEPAESNQQGG